MRAKGLARRELLSVEEKEQPQVNTNSDDHPKLIHILSE